MIRCAARAWPGAVALLLALPAAASAECPRWSDPTMVVDHGTLRGLPPGAVRFRIGRAAAGGSHMQTLVELRWTEPGGREARQAIFGGMQDGLPVLSQRHGQLRLRVTSCPAGQDCRDRVLGFVWDPALRRFAASDPAAAEALAGACVAE